MRDRPPKYETQHNYDTRIQQEQEQQQQQTNETNDTAPTEPTLPEISIIENLAPPTYDGSRESVSLGDIRQQLFFFVYWNENWLQINL